MKGSKLGELVKLPGENNVHTQRQRTYRMTQALRCSVLSLPTCVHAVFTMKSNVVLEFHVKRKTN